MSSIPFIGKLLILFLPLLLMIKVDNMYLVFTYWLHTFDCILDIGANLTDPMFKGIYNGNKKHKEDLEDVLERAWKNDLKKIIITSGSLDDSIESLKIASLNGILFI